MTYDLKITGGRIVDGTGKAAFSGDIGIKDGTIVAVGHCEGNARETLAADGALVTPGFTDIHTHYDGQVSWDEELRPSSVHGVTTAAMGSCGVGFAPVKKTDHDRLIGLMEGVEDIPGVALAEGVTWDWESFPEYMDAIDAMPHAIDFAAHLPHDALRMYVMGDRALWNEPATDEDIAAMKALTAQALDAGAIGFSTGRTDNHRLDSGLPTPASEATDRELIGIAEAFRGRSTGVLQAVSDFDLHVGDERFDYEWAILEKMVEASGGRPLSMTWMQRFRVPDQWEHMRAKAEAANERGLTMRLQCAARGIGVLVGLTAKFHPFVGYPSYKAIAHLPLAERTARMRDPQFKSKLLSESSDKMAGDGSSVPEIVDFFLANVDMVAMRLFNLGEEPNYEPDPMTCMTAKAQQRGVSVLDLVYDEMLENDGKALLYFPVFNYHTGNLDTTYEMLRHPLSLPGLSDGGAHVGTICDASFPTFLLSHWARDRKGDKLTVEEVVKKQAFDTARYLGLTDRGAIAVGQRADVNIIDFDNLKLKAPRVHYDLPAGGARMLQEAEGYLATLCKGEIIARNGTLTGARPGRLVRRT